MDSKYICTLCKVPRVCVSVPHAVLSPGAVPETESECTVSALVGLLSCRGDGPHRTVSGSGSRDGTLG